MIIKLNEVERFDPDSKGNIVGMRRGKNGDYVSFMDYKTLEKRMWDMGSPSAPINGW